jgi:hypothetical protein
MCTILNMTLIIKIDAVPQDAEMVTTATSINIIMQTTRRIPESPDDPILRKVLCNIQTKEANSVLQISSIESLVSRQTPVLYEYYYVNG